MDKTSILAWFWIVSVVQGNLQKVFPISSVNVTNQPNQEVKVVQVRQCSEEEIEEKCKGFKYALVREEQNQTTKNVTCLNSWNFDFLSLGVSPIKIQKICKTSLISTIFGAFQVEYNGVTENTTTLLILQQLQKQQCERENHEYFACFDQRILEDNNVLDEDDNCTNNILAIYTDGSETKRKALNGLNNTRVWDYSGNCHSRLYQNTSFPIGHSIGGEMNSFSVAVYCKDITECQAQLQTSNQNNGNVGLVDLTFRQNKCIHAADLTDFPDPVSDTDLSVEHGGKFSCVDACRNATGEYVLAVVDETNCYCTTYGDAFPNVMEDKFTDCKPCPDNDNFTCGKQTMYSVYHTKDDFGVNAGYKYFQCVNAKLYNDPKELLDPNLIQVNSVETATECFTNC